jgi:putative transcriptional regulator
MALQNRIKVLRAERDWTQEQLAELVGVTRKTVNTVERGVYIPSTELALKLARAFGVAVENIFSLADEAAPRA